MKLRDIVVPSKNVSIDGEQSFSVNGISAVQAFHIYQNFRSDLTVLYDQLSGRSEPVEVLQSVEGIVAAFPELVGHIIAVANGTDPDDAELAADADAARRLPLGAQVDALMKIAELTFTPDMPPKKFFGLLVAKIKQAQSLITTSDSGSGS